MSDYFVTGLIFSGLGILFGLLPGWLCCADIIGTAITIQKKDLPSWVFYIAGGNPRTRKLNIGILSESSSHILVWIISIIWLTFVLLFFVVFDYFALVNSGGNQVKGIIIRAVFPIFVLITWLLPIILLKRWLNLKSQDLNNKI